MSRRSTGRSARRPGGSARTSAAADEDGRPGDAALEADPGEPDAGPLADPDPGAAAAPEVTALVPSAPAGSLAHLDPLSRYLREISAYGLLSAEEERELALRFREDGDVQAAVRLATGNLRLVVGIALQYRNTWQNLLDLVQEGNVGLMKAIEKFDPHRGLRFSTYATWWIKAYMLKYLLDNWSMVRFGTSNARRKVFFNLRKEQERLRQSGVEPAAELLARRLEVSVQDVREVGAALDQKDSSLDAPLGEDGDATVSALLPARQPLPDEVVAEQESRDMLRRQFARFAGTLPERERAVFEERLAAEDPLTLQDLADRFGMTREGMRQVEKRLVAQFKAFVESEMAGYDLELHGVSREET